MGVDFFRSGAWVSADAATLFALLEDFGSRKIRAAFEATDLLVFSFLAMRMTPKLDKAIINYMVRLTNESKVGANISQGPEWRGAQTSV